VLHRLDELNELLAELPQDEQVEAVRRMFGA
jgi:hypothetical protein